METSYWMSARNLNPISRTTSSSSSAYKTTGSSTRPHSRRNEFSPITKQGQRTPRRLITISTSSSTNGRWNEKWSCDYILSLQDLQLQDLAEGNDTPVSINLCIQKHASFGLSVEGKIITSFTSKCSICSSPYCKRIDTDFNIWVLSSRRRSAAARLPEIGGDDPSVLYVKPGQEADLDSVIQDTIRLATSVKGTCSDLCEKSEPRTQYVGEHKAASIDWRWSRLLQLRNSF